MQPIIEFLKKNPWFFYAFSILMLFPALLWHLGYLAINFPTDEPTRAIVALEMIISDNFFTPTINGDFYYNKPPLYNWIIIAFYKIFGNYSEFTLRLPVVIGLLLFAITIYYFVSKETGKKQAFIVAMLFITSGRILFWDSFLGLIDITFSWLVYTSFMCVYFFDKSKKYLLLFITTYFLTAITFLMKGLPSLVFQAITLLTFFTYRKEFMKLFSWKHFVGIGLLILIIGSYYIVYAKHNVLDNVFTTLFSESEKRTIINYGWKRFITHLFTFPLEMFYHFFPWSILGIYFISRKFLPIVKSHPFLLFNFFIFIFNIIIYWTSPETYPRYIFMLFPPIFTVLIYMFYKDTEVAGVRSKIIEYFLQGVIMLGMIAAIIMPVLKQTGWVDQAWIKAAILFLILGILLFFFIKIKDQRLVIFAAAMLMLRIGFDWFIIPPRYNDFQEHKIGALSAAKATDNEKLFIYKDSETEHATSFYITLGKMEILRHKYKDFDTTSYYYLDPRLLPEEDYTTIYDFKLYRHDQPIKIVKLKRPSAN
jgi:4-amino-4-deoxy-L-arabinose transferase-like glycosyltransferase